MQGDLFHDALTTLCGDGSLEARLTEVFTRSFSYVKAPPTHLHGQWVAIQARVPETAEAGYAGTIAAMSHQERRALSAEIMQLCVAVLSMAPGRYLG